MEMISAYFLKKYHYKLNGSRKDANDSREKGNNTVVVSATAVHID